MRSLKREVTALQYAANVPWNSELFGQKINQPFGHDLGDQARKHAVDRSFWKSDGVAELKR